MEEGVYLLGTFRVPPTLGHGHCQEVQSEEMD